MKNDRLEVRQSPKGGRGVFALVDFAEGDEIEHVPLIVARSGDREVWEQTSLVEYFYWEVPEAGGAAVMLGYGSLYNHSFEPNGWYTKEPENEAVMIRAHRPIAVGEEITLRYTTDASNLWFEVK